MIDKLLKIFIKDYKKTKSEKVRNSYGIFASCIGLITNIILVLSKLTAGILFLNISIIADALNNLTDFVNCILNIFGFKLANKPADEEHPYGHQRIEYIVSLIVSIIILAIGINIFYQGILSIIHPSSKLTSFPIASFLVLFIGIFIKGFQSIIYYSLGKKISSISLIALGADARNDILSTIGVIIGLIISYYTGFTQIDGIIACLVSIFILYTAFTILKETCSLLIGKRTSQELIDELIKLLKREKEVLGLHDLEIHEYGQNMIFASIHVEVDGSKDIFYLHDIIDKLERKAFKELNIKLVIHMDPIKINDPQTNEYKKMLEKVLSSIDKDITFHDFRIVSTSDRINLIFDIILPDKLRKNEKKIIYNIKAKMKKFDDKTHLIITVDEQYAIISKEND